MQHQNHKYFRFSFALILFLFASHLIAQNDEMIAINKAIENSKWEKVSDHCQETIRLFVQQTQGNFSKTQARYILADFFKKNPATKTTIIKSGKVSEGFFFSILQCKTADKTFNIYYTIQENKGSYLINEFQIKEKSK